MARVNPTHVPSEEQIEKERQVLEMRRAGMSFDEIAPRAGYANRGGAYKAYKRALARTLQVPAAEIRELEQDRLDRLQVAVWPKALRGDLGAVDRVLRISERRARLLGLDHADGIAERALELEAGKVRLIALAVGRMFDALELTDEQRERGTAILLAELRATEGDDAGEVVVGEVTA